MALHYDGVVDSLRSGYGGLIWNTNGDCMLAYAGTYKEKKCFDGGTICCTMWPDSCSKCELVVHISMAKQNRRGEIWLPCLRSSVLEKNLAGLPFTIIENFGLIMHSMSHPINCCGKFIFCKVLQINS